MWTSRRAACPWQHTQILGGEVQQRSAVEACVRLGAPRACACTSAAECIKGRACIPRTKIQRRPHTHHKSHAARNRHPSARALAGCGCGGRGGAVGVEEGVCSRGCCPRTRQRVRLVENQHGHGHVRRPAGVHGDYCGAGQPWRPCGSLEGLDSPFLAMAPAWASQSNCF